MNPACHAFVIIGPVARPGSGGGHPASAEEGAWALRWVPHGGAARCGLTGLLIG